MKPNPTFIDPAALMQGRMAGLWQSIGSQPKPPDDVVEWLARARLLYGVPFEYIVPDAALLPIESVRFFFVDESWIDALIDGALAVAKASTFEHVHHEANCAALRAAVAEKSLELRKTLRGVDPVRTYDTKVGPVSGMLIRSRLISGYPGVEVVANPGSDPAMALLRIDRPAPDLLFVLFNGVPHTIELREPREGVVPGIAGVVQATGEARYKRMEPDAQGNLQGKEDLTFPFRAGGKRVLDILRMPQPPLPRKRSAPEIAGNLLRTQGVIRFLGFDGGPRLVWKDQPLDWSGQGGPP